MCERGFNPNQCFCKKISTVTTTTQSPTFSELNVMTPRHQEDALEIFQRSMDQIYGNSGSQSVSSQSVLQDLEILPREITLNDVQVSKFFLR